MVSPNKSSRSFCKRSQAIATTCYFLKQPTSCQNKNTKTACCILCIDQLEQSENKRVVNQKSFTVFPIWLITAAVKLKKRKSQSLRKWRIESPTLFMAWTRDGKTYKPYYLPNKPVKREWINIGGYLGKTTYTLCPPLNVCDRRSYMLCKKSLTTLVFHKTIANFAPYLN